MVIYVDNKSSIALAKNAVFQGRSKHIDIHCNFIRECVEGGEVVIKHVRTDLQQADTLTKALSTVKFERMPRFLGVKDYADKFKLLRSMLAFNLNLFVFEFELLVCSGCSAGVEVAA